MPKVSPLKTPQIFVNGKKTRQDRLLPASFLEEKMFAFESLKSYGGVIFRLDEHLDRLFETAKTIGLELSRTREELTSEVIESLKQASFPPPLSSPRLKRGEVGRGVEKNFFVRLMVDEYNSYIFILERKRPDVIYKQGVDLKTAVTRRHFPKAEPPEAKANAFLNNVFAAMERELSGAFESIFLDQEGYVTEAAIWNVFMVKAGILMTPGTGILRGVTRQFVIECAVKEHLPVQETNLTRHDFWNADEAFLTNTSGEIVPIRSLDGRMIGTQVPGNMTKQLMARFRKEVEKPACRQAGN